MKLKQFQEDATNDVSDAIKKLLSHQKEQKANGKPYVARVVLKSPTGSGKTMMVAQILKDLEDYLDGREYAFIWAAPNKLHLQSHKKLEKELADTRYKLVDIEDVPQGPLEDDTVLFTNWEKVFKQDKDGEWANKAVKQGETERNLQDVMEATRDAGVGVVLLVDESHQSFYGPKSQQLVNEVIIPDMVFEFSATPKTTVDNDTSSDEYYSKVINIGDVIESGLIKKEIIINKDIEDQTKKKKEPKSAIEAVVDEALKRRDILQEKYKEQGKDINPLVLIQLPSSNSEVMTALDKKDLDIIEEILVSRGYTYGDGSLAIWLADAENKKNLEGIEKNNNQAKVLIFKQAIALGWDCPRAQILVMLRDVKSETFKIQTVGRIMRMPEAKHYDDPDLDTAYVYTDLSKIEIDKDDKDGQNLIKYQNSKREKGRNIKLPDSIFLHRVDYGDLRADFKVMLIQALDKKFNIKERESKKSFIKKVDELLEITPEELKTPIISNETIENLDEYSKEEAQTIDIKMDQTNVERVFNIQLRSFSGKFKNFARSRGIICATLYKWFEKADISVSEVERIIACSEENQKIFREIFTEAIDKYDSHNQKEMQKRRAREVESMDFEIPAVDDFSDNYESVEMEKHATQPYYRKKNAPKSTEIPFEKALEKSKNVEFWYKNGEKMQRYFAVEYSYMDDNAKTHRGAFYPDYLVKYKDGSIGIYDTKSGFTASDEHAAQKANALQKYILDHKKLNLKGGLIKVEKDKFLIQDDPDYENDNAKKWKEFSL